ncbi:hypothetical protein SAMN05216226_103137 [Halovenus aranensis]|jgi:hypothetical protein|uniref:Uncharacterized protein n=1 Tax=Halovenus aranensis TaxID=890420 RepID=A0A1G8TLB8_9EURY|nr:hypothetical protein [Halovenus aranensis]SDJ42382.1 hypothetical protein SAMN05216226_103137 [Halovenus aranensis]
MYDMTADRENNRLYIDLAGRMDAEEIEAAAEAAVSEAETLDDEFDIINDLSGFKPPSPEAAEPIKDAQGTLREMGVDRVVRVIDEDTSTIVLHAFERRSTDVGYSGERADSVAEAERLLDTHEIAGYT